MCSTFAHEWEDYDDRLKFISLKSLKQVVARFGILCHYFPLQSPLEFISHLIEMVREYVYIQTLQRWEGCGVTKSIPCTLVGLLSQSHARLWGASVGKKQMVMRLEWKDSSYYITCSAFVSATKASYWDRLNLRSRNGQRMAHYVCGKVTLETSGTA
jgi:hypothetical protein